MSLSAVIVDDEQLARDELAFLLKSTGEVDVVAQGKNGVEVGAQRLRFSLDSGGGSERIGVARAEHGVLWPRG